MNFFLIMGTLCIFLDLNAETKLMNCKSKLKKESENNLIFPFGYVCTKSSCDWSVDSTCKNGTYSEVIKWETDIFEIGFEGIDHRRPKEIVITIELNDDYYIEINVICEKEMRTVKIILNECSHKGKQCLENRNFTEDILDIVKDHTYVAIGFRKDKKMNFVGVSGKPNIASDLFGPENEYEFKMPGFQYSTYDTMKITVSSKYYENYTYNGVLMHLPTSVGGFFFNKNGYLTNEKDSWCDNLYINPNEGKGLPYIIKEYFDNSENWKAPPVKWTPAMEIPYFDENGMKVKQEEMKVKEVKNPNFDETKMIRKRCKYVEKNGTDLETEAPETVTVSDDSVNEGGVVELPDTGTGFTDSLSEITIADEIFIRKTDSSKENIKIKEFIERVGGNESLHKDYLSNVGKGGDDYNVTLKNGSFVNLRNWMFAKTKEKGEGGAGDASRGQKEVKNICPKYVVILILMILSM